MTEGYQTLEEPFECANCGGEIDAVQVLAPVESISVDAEIICGMCGRESGERVVEYV